MAEPECPRCLKSPELCICETITPMDTDLEILILQHPQEPDKELGTARIAQQSLARATLRVGLSWSNLSKALGRPAVHGEWGVLYLGGQAASKVTPLRGQRPTIHITTKLGKTFAPGQVELRGIVVLDGTWSQAKTLWWRNPWLLKLKRIILTPSRPSLYGKLRREPRRECLSTIEAIAESLEALGEPKQVSDTLRGHFAALLRKAQLRPVNAPRSV